MLLHFLILSHGILTLIDAAPSLPTVRLKIWLSFFGIGGIIILASSLLIPRLISFAISRLGSTQVQEIYQQIVYPVQNQLGLILFLSLTDIAILVAPLPEWLAVLEVPLGLSITIAMSWLGSRLFRQFFDVYFLNIALRNKRKINSELLIVFKFLANASIIVIVVFIFSQTHHLNLVGLLASLGIGGLAVAFAAQKTLEQLLGGIVLYLDRPFVVDDYIHLPDRTFGRVESIGWRSTKIRTSGKGSLVIIPNNILTQTTIENLTNAKKIISLIYLTFYQEVLEEEKAFIRQIILDSTQDIFGLDHRITQVKFQDIVSEKDKVMVQAQVTFFILGSGEISMEIRSQLLEIAGQNISQKLHEYGIDFDLEKKQVNVVSPVNV
ncbi:MAG: mechanosensitive ion channel domain-containing protein [Microcoleaceae cyanobacterium]